MSIPIIDISPLRCSTKNTRHPSPSQTTTLITPVVNQIASACQSHGFFAVINHGVPASLIAKMSRASSSFFDLTTPVKRQVCMSEDYPYGYENYESLGVKFTSKAEVGSVDSKETFSIGPQLPSRVCPRASSLPINPSLKIH